MSHRAPARLFEWTMSLALVGVSAILGASRHASLGGMRAGELGVPVIALAGVLAATGFTRIVGLFNNGHWPKWGPFVRAGGAAIGAMMWGQVLCWFLVSAVMNGIVPIGIATYAALMIGEIASCHRACSDVRLRAAG